MKLNACVIALPTAAILILATQQVSAQGYYQRQELTADAQEWTSYRQYKDREVFIDMGSIKTEGSFVKYRTKVVHATPQQRRDHVFQVQVQSLAVDCLAKKHAYYSITNYTLQGDVVKTFDYDPLEFSAHPPESQGANEEKFVCDVSAKVK